MLEQVKAVVQEELYVLDGRLENCPDDEIDNVFRIALMCLKSLQEAYHS